MKKGGIGVGSASIVLVFAVLCLTVFSLIAFVVAGNDKALVDAEARLVVGYYEADALAERVVAGIMESGYVPETMHGVDIAAFWDWDSGAEIAEFFCPISEQKSLLVRLAIYGDTYDVLSWRMFDTDEWTFDDSLNVWEGPDDIGFGDPMDIFSGLDIDD